MHNPAMPLSESSPARMPSRHPLREPMLWLVIGLPVAAVVAGLLTLWIAIRAGGNDAIAEPVRRTAQIQVRDLAADEAARAAGLALLLQRDANGLRLMRLTGAAGHEALQLHLRHPSLAAADRTITLQPDAGAWQARGVLPADHDWRLELLPADGAWRLVGRLPAGAITARLEPALPAAASTPAAGAAPGG